MSQTQIPLFITASMRKRLLDLGFTEEQIDAMTPEEAWKPLGGMPAQNPKLDAALRYAAKGWYVFPCKPGEKAPLTQHGHLEATTDHEQIRAWWSQWPDANIGIACGPSGLALLDLDVKNGRDGPENWRDLCQQHRIDDSQALQQLTPSSGTHLVFKVNGHKIRNSASLLAPGIDVRGDGGYFIVEPSSLADGGQYVWEASSHPDDKEPGFVPDKLADLLNKPDQADDPWQVAEQAKLPYTLPEALPQGQRNDQLFRYACSLRSHGLEAADILTLVHARNRERCVPPLGDDEIRQIVDHVTSAYLPGQVSAQDDTQQPAALANQVAGKQQRTYPRCFLTRSADDAGNADCVREFHGDRFRHTDSHGWLYYNGRFWDAKLGEAYLGQAIVDTLRERRHAAVQANREDIVKVTRASAINKNGCKNILADFVKVDIGIFDTNPNLLNACNGVIDLRTGQLLAHDQGQLFTYAIPTEYDPAAKSELWETFLQEAVGDPFLIDYLQVSMGYSLTGHTSEECLFYLQGPTRAGKGTFTETILEMLGKKPMGTETDFGTFTRDRDQDSQNFDLAGLKACRIVVAGESEKREPLNPARIKALTGGNDVRCAFKHKDHFTYRPQYKIWLASNYAVNSDVDDDAVWVRVKVIEFPHSFAGHEDKSLKAELKQPEHLKAVLAWAVKGAIRWYNQGAKGLSTPIQVKAATQKARDDLDYVGQWLAECVEKTNNNADFLTNSALYLSYENWCKGNGVTPKKQTALTQALRHKGYRAGEVKKIPDPGSQKLVTKRGCFQVRFIT